MPKATPKEGSCLGAVRFYRSRHARIRELKRQTLPLRVRMPYLEFLLAAHGLP